MKHVCIYCVGVFSASVAHWVETVALPQHLPVVQEVARASRRPGAMSTVLSVGLKDY